MAHGDESGLRLPPRVAPIQAVIVPIWRKEPEREAVATLAGEVERALRAAGVRVKADWREERPGFKYSHWELRGVPLRIEIGPRDAASGQVVLVPRTNRAAKETVSKDGVARRVQDLLAEVQQSLYDQALAFRLARTRTATNADEFRTLLTDPAGPYFVEGWWCGDAACEAAIKAETQVTIRNLPLEQPDRAEGTAQGGETCVWCGRPGAAWAVFAKAY
jgi:prolyl-tRNA synthetase